MNPDPKWFSPNQATMLVTRHSRESAGLSGERVNELWLHAKRHLGLVVSFWLKRLRKECLACATKIRCSAVC